MGWDAYATKNNKYLETSEKGEYLIDENLRKEFEKAHLLIKSKCDSVDPYLKTGALDNSLCRDMLHEATINVLSVDKTCYEDWNEIEVKLFDARADWNFKYEKEDEWAFLSAKHFLKICANNDLGIHFSY